MNISDLARWWITANFLTMVATAAFGLLGFGIRYLLEVESADAALSAKFWYVTAEIVMTTAGCALSARRIGKRRFSSLLVTSRVCSTHAASDRDLMSSATEVTLMMAMMTRPKARKTR
jgi:hypothetical protein